VTVSITSIDGLQTNIPAGLAGHLEQHSEGSSVEVWEYFPIELLQDLPLASGVSHARVEPVLELS
jgi:hypothetical protein